MRKNYINQIPMPACVVDKDGIVLRANPLIKEVFVYEDIAGAKIFTLTGLKRETLMHANEEEIILERNNRLFKIRTNANIKEDDDIIVFFDEATAREAFRTKLEDERAAIVYIYIDNYDDLIASSGEERRTLPTQIDNIIISPRIMGSATGLHPALVLVAITVGSSVSGIAGMLFSVPALLVLRSIARNWPVPCENV